MPQSDVLILLGGEPTSRILHALRIYNAGKASPLIVISAGNLPWQAAVVPEAQLIADRLVELGAPRSAPQFWKPKAETRGKTPSILLRSSKSMAGELVSSSLRGLICHAPFGTVCHRDTEPSRSFEARQREIIYSSIISH